MSVHLKTKSTKVICSKILKGGAMCSRGICVRGMYVQQNRSRYGYVAFSLGVVCNICMAHILIAVAYEI